MTTLREAAQQAEAVLRGCLEHPDAADAIAALRAALAEPDHLRDATKKVAEPVAWAMPRSDGLILDVICPEEHDRMPGQYTVPLYTQPKAEHRPPNCGTGFCSCIECPYVQPKAEQEPVGTYEEVMQTMRSLQTGTLVAQQQMFELLKDKPLYAAPQPRKRLDVHQILDLMPEGVPARYDGELIAFCRAIEAAVWGEQHGS
jgi:hypothetical protein